MERRCKRKMIEIKNLCKSYDKVTVYDDFNLTLKDGEINCILGESGSGKTTLLNCVAHLTPFEGEIPKLKCSYIFQSPTLVPNLTVFENLSLVCKDGDKITAMLESVRLSDKARFYPKNLSGGQSQRVAIARAFLYPADVILMDEPFSSLDLKLKAEMIELFFEVWKNDRRTALFVTHDIDEALSVASRITVIARGKIVFDEALSSPAPRAIGSEESMRKKLFSVLTSP